MRSGTEIAGRYRLDEKIASGGMGQVWKGTDTRLKRTVAIKLLHSGLSGDDRFRARFEQEARAVASLQSPGIVALYDYGEDSTADNRMSYLVMELVQGKSLAGLIKEFGRFGADEVMDIMAAAAEALDTAHRAGVIHRDIKPANLLVSDDFSVKIVDFGIASARGSAGLTETGTVIGTLNYASPEQLNGEKVDGSSDLYSLGVVAYECLAGKPPFTAEVPVAIMNGHINMPPPPLPDDIPEPVAAIVMRTLSKDPADRWESAAALAAACRSRDPGERRSNAGDVSGAAAADAATKLAAAAVVSGTREMPAVDGANDPDATGAVAPVAAVESGSGRPVWPLLSGAGGVVALAVLLSLWAPWDAPSGTLLPSDGETSQVERVAESPSEEPSTYEEWTGNSGGGNQPSEEPTSEEPTSEEPTSEEPSPTDEETTPDEDPTTPGGEDPDPDPEDPDPDPEDPVSPGGNQNPGTG